MFDEDKAARAEYFVSCLRHTKGKWAGKPWAWVPWQRDLIRTLFGTVDADGLRQYQTCFVAIPKKNGKSEMAAAIGGLLTLADFESGAEVYSAAADRAQAALCFDVFAQMCRQSQVLSDRVKILDSQKRVVVPETHSFWRVLSAEVATKHGINPHGVIFDELHAQPHRRLYDTLMVGTGAARSQPLRFIITTAGNDRNSICYEVWDYARRVSRGEIDDPRFLPLIYELGDDEDWENPSNWARVNPSLGYIFDEAKLADEYKDARRSPASENSFRQLRLNQWVRQEVRWIDMASWRACRADIDEAALAGRPCYVGLDLAAVSDCNAMVLAFPGDDGGLPLTLVPRLWIPREAAEKQERLYNTPWSAWARQGAVTIMPGRVADQDMISAQLFADAERFGVREVAYDEWGAFKLMTDIGKQNPPFELVPMRQGMKTLSPPAKEFERLVIESKIRHPGNPVLDWMVESAEIIQDANQRIRPVKPDRARAEKIDGVMAMLMAIQRAVAHQEGYRSAYETDGVMFV